MLERVRTRAHAVNGFAELLALELGLTEVPPTTLTLLDGLTTACDEFLIEIRSIEASATSPSDEEAETALSVLVVDDSPANQLLTKAQLDRLGVASTAATSGAEALDLVAEHRFSLILMDWHMPGLDGLETTRRIRRIEQQQGSRPHRIVALTARAMVGDRDRCLEAGMDDFVTKPVSLDDLRNVIETCERSALGEVAVTNDSDDEHAFAVPPELIDEETYTALVRDIDNADIVAQLTATFVEELQSRCAELDTALIGGDFATARRSAHTIKGTSALFGARPLAELATAIEAQCESGLVDARDAGRFDHLANATATALSNRIQHVDRAA